MHIRTWGFGFVTLLFQVASGAAQDAAPRDTAAAFRLGEITVQEPRAGASRFEEAVDAMTLRRFDRSTVAAGLNLLPGVTLSNIGLRNELGVYIRGFDLRQVPLLIDGLPVYVPYDGYVDLGRFTTFDVAQIQVARGFSSALLGPNALGGAINVVSRRPTSRYEANLGAGAFTGSGYQTYANIGSAHERWYVQASGSYLTQDDFHLSSDFAGGSIEDGGNRNNADRTDWRVSGKFAVTPSGTDEYAIGVGVQRGDKGNPPYAGSDPAQTVRYWRWPQWDKTNVYALTRTAIGGSSYVKGRAYYDRFDNRLSAYDDATYRAQTRRSSFTSIYFDDTWGGSAELGTGRVARHALKAAAHLKLDTHREHNVGEPTRRYRDRTMSFGFEDTYQATARLAVVAGVSYDRRHGVHAEDLQNGAVSELPSTSSGSWNPQAAVLFDLRSAGSLRASVAHKSRFPTIKDRYSYRLGTAIPNPDLEAERAWHGELAYARPAFGGATVRGSIFYSRIDDLIQRVDDVARDDGNLPLFQLRNVGDARAIGFDVGADARAAPWASVGANYSWIDRKNLTNPSTRLIDTPKAKVLVYGDAAATRWVGVIGSFEWNSSRFTSTHGATVPEFAVVNLKVRLRPRAGMVTEAGFSNLFDKNYALTEGFPEPGRTFIVNVSYDLSGR